jgi:DNA repair protein SbcD/Mre11
MQGKFAHISDCHIGAWREPKLREWNDNALAETIDRCIKSRVDFLVISGDVFDTGIPEMSSVRSAVKKFRELLDNEIPVYVVYGSHDYSPTTVSMVDVLTSAGIFINAGEFEEALSGQHKETKKLSLKPVVDKKTGVLLAGLPARKMGIEKEYYKELERRSIGKAGYSIFVFHAAISEMTSKEIPTEESVSLKELPKGFSYYAGGHIHKRSRGQLDGSPVVYQGPIFGTSYTDLELSGQGEKRGFAIVHYEGSKTTGIEFIDLPTPRIISESLSATNKSSDQVSKEISAVISQKEAIVRDSIVLLRVKGNLASGKPSDIDWFGFRTRLLEKGALVAHINRLGLTTAESTKLKLLGANTREEIESKLLEERISSFKPSSAQLESFSSKRGATKALKLLQALKTEKLEEETKQNFEKRIWTDASGILELESDER